MKLHILILIMLLMPACATRRYIVQCTNNDPINGSIDVITDKEPEYQGSWIEFNDGFYDVRTNAPCSVRPFVGGKKGIAPWDAAKFSSQVNSWKD